MKQPGKHSLADVLGHVAEKETPTPKEEVSSDVQEFLEKVSSYNRPSLSFKQQDAKTVVELSIAS